jgi:hypothetical protein
MSGSDLATRAANTRWRSVDTLSRLKNDRWAVGKSEQDCSHAELGLRCLSRLDQIWISVSAIETIEPNR